jgi:tRNA1Val (adenine37-N6)-methyltransferase
MEFFRCKQFVIRQDRAAWKVGTDSMLLGSWVDVGEASHALDLGTGTGILALMLAQRSQNLIVHGVEVDPGSIADARENFAQSPWADRLGLYAHSLHDLLQAVTLPPQDLIVSNPPFFSEGVLPENSSRRLARHTIGFNHHDLLQLANSLLTPPGRLAVILPATEGERFLSSAEKEGYSVQRLCEVYSRMHKPVRRYLIEIGKMAAEQPLREMLVLHGSGRGYSEAYQELTRDFHTIF